MTTQKTEKNDNKTENLKQEIDKWVQEFSATQKKFDRFDVYEGEQLDLGFLAYKDDKGQITVLISMHGQRPTNSLSFPVNGLEDIKQITKLLEKYEELFKYIEKYEQNVKNTKRKKNLIE
jgi:hypothetical protein